MKGLVAGVWRRPTGRFAVVALAALMVAAGLSLFYLPHPLLQTDTSARWQGPSLDHLLGTDSIGRDIFSWLLAGSRTTVAVIIASTAAAALVGFPLAALTALLRPRLAEPAITLVDILIAFPTLLLAMLLAVPFGGSLALVVVAVGFTSGLRIARVTRPEIARVWGSDYLLAAKAAGASSPRRFIQHVLPNVAPIALVQLSLAAGLAILAEAGLTYLGYGAPPAVPSWGRSLAASQQYVQVAPLSVIWPGLAIAVTVLALGLLGDALREAADPRLSFKPRPLEEVESVAVAS
ncbi:MAG: ABC transporter permease [Bifidobacteriaceae bacterium]|jgi:peptide/nickel transport system permease protein|nr:ABC transporter permease [Bifidobacteriaceae bacterium]